MQDIQDENPEEGEENPEADLKKGEKQNLNEQENK